MNRAMLMVFGSTALATASRPPAPRPRGWTIYGDVIVEVLPRDR